MKTEFLKNEESWTANFESMLTEIQNDNNTQTLEKFEELALNADWIEYANRVFIG